MHIVRKCILLIGLRVVWHVVFTPHFCYKCRFLRELDLQENEVDDHRGQWLSCFPDCCTTLESLNFACLKGEINLGALERLVARSPNLKSLRLNHTVPLSALQRILMQAPQLVDLGIGSFIHDPHSDVYTRLRNTIKKCKSMTSLSGFFEVLPGCLRAIYPVCMNLTALNLSYAAGIHWRELIKLICLCGKLQRLWVNKCILPKSILFTHVLMLVNINTLYTVADNGLHWRLWARCCGFRMQRFARTKGFSIRSYWFKWPCRSLRERTCCNLQGLL